ncbi:family 20 glycosylhydrolase [Allokutzneria oryzae]|uniref:beta-N-acetylhexosaminidase n=1 Tax=Allokutzneria oryzae TaxID=1378989 RepID=A0ABV5ZSC0_9PSEU
MRSPRIGARLGGALAAVVLAGAGLAASGPTARAHAPASSFADVVPAPVKATPNAAVTFAVTSGTKIYTQPGSAEAAGVGSYLGELLRRPTGFPLPVSPSAGTPAGGISLLLTGADPAVGEQGYQLETTADKVVIRATKAAGLFAGVQTLRQLLPAAVESTTVKPGPWTVPGGSVLDHPRFGYRGAHLDVARHFFPVQTVKRYIDELAAYKINNLHLHLTDDQGWRIEIKSWPKLATYGGSTQVGGGPGGYYTQEQYKEIIAHAASRHMTVIPEFDMPGHTNSALASYAELNCNGVAPPLRTDIEVGYSSLCINKDITYKFVDDVVREISALTPGKYFHLGGDEAHATSEADYNTFMTKVVPIVTKYGKTAIGWHEAAKTKPDLPTSTVLQFWDTKSSNPAVAAAAARGNKVLMSPANKAYLDMKYNANTPLGLSWAGYIEVQDAYNWNPATYAQGVGESSVFGVEAPLWSETLKTLSDIEFMAFPRLPAIAELGWSPASAQNWDAFKQRLGAQGPRWAAAGINYYKSPQVPWRTGTTDPEPGACDNPAWDRVKVYTGGTAVSHGDREWRAKWWTQGDEPGTTGQWGVWQDLGACK